MDLELLAREEAKRWRHLDEATKHRWMNQFLRLASEHAPKERVTPAGRIAEQRRKLARLEPPEGTDAADPPIPGDHQGPLGAAGAFDGSPFS